MLMVHSLPTSGKMSKKGKNISIYSRFLDHQISILALKILTVQAVYMKFPGLRKTHFTCLKLQLNKFYSVSQSSARIFKKNLFRFLFCFLLCMFLFHNQPFFATSCFLIKIKKNKKQMLNCKIETKYHFKINKTRVQF